MKCARCAAEVPGQAQFCMKCGTPVTFGRKDAAATITRPISGYSAPKASKKPAPVIIALVVALCLALVALGYLGMKNLAAKNSAAQQANNGVVNLHGVAQIGTGLTDKNGRIVAGGQITDKSATAQLGPADPVDVIDYLKHVRQTEKVRLTLQRKQTASILEWSSKMTAENIKEHLGDNEPDPKKNYVNFQNDVNRMATEWEELSRAFNAYPKPVPQACIALRGKYLDVLGKTSSAVTKIGNSFARAMSGDSTNALESLTAMQGDQSVDQACDKADEELANVSDKWHLHKDFDIRADGGASNPFGVGK